MAKAYPKDHPLHALVASVAHCVWAARLESGQSRRRLAELSGLSERFLADIEAEAANPSLGSLQALAKALSTTVPKLLDAEALLTPRLGKLLTGKTEAELEIIADWVEARDRGQRPGVRVALVGLRGAGKTTVGKLLAKKLNCQFVELDALVEDRAGLPLAQIFEIHGESHFRRLEREALREVLDERWTIVLATGGGLVSNADTYAMLRAAMRTVWLRAKPEEHLARVLRQGDKRPVERRPQALAELRALLAAREPRYREAELTVDTSGASAEDAVRRIGAFLERGQATGT